MKAMKNHCRSKSFGGFIGILRNKETCQETIGGLGTNNNVKREHGNNQIAIMNIK